MCITVMKGLACVYNCYERVNVYVSHMSGEGGIVTVTE